MSLNGADLPVTEHNLTRSSPKQPHTVIAIDIIRAVAALGVLFYHQHIGYLLVERTKIAAFMAIDAFGANYAVPLFFLISGYCIHLSNIKYLKLNQALPLKTYYTRRFLRIYPPYLLALITAIVINFFTGIEKNPSLNDVLVHVFALQGFVQSSFNTINVVLWTISIELAFYLIYPVFYYLRLKYSLNRALLFSLLVSCISIALTIIITNGQYNFAQKYFVLNIWFAWCCGAFLADKKIFNPAGLAKPVYKLIYTFIIAGFITSLNFYHEGLSVVYYQFSILIWTAPVVYLISKEDWFKRHQKSTRIIAAIGLSSYSLYLLHEPLIYLKNFLVHNYIPAKFRLPAMLIGFAFIPVIAWFNYKLIEKPFIRLKKG